MDKLVGDEVIGGSLNQAGSLVVKVTRVGPESFLRTVARSVAEARALKPGILRLVDRVLLWFVPAVFTTAANAVARDVGTEAVVSEVLPAEKAELVRSLQREGRKVAYVSLYVARSEDGVRNWRVEPTPLLLPGGPVDPYVELGCEDPRVTYVPSWESG